MRDRIRERKRRQNGRKKRKTQIVGDRDTER